ARGKHPPGSIPDGSTSTRIGKSACTYVAVYRCCVRTNNLFEKSHLYNSWLSICNLIIMHNLATLSRVEISDRQVNDTPLNILSDCLKRGLPASSTVA